MTHCRSVPPPRRLRRQAVSIEETSCNHSPAVLHRLNRSGPVLFLYEIEKIDSLRLPPGLALLCPELLWISENSNIHEDGVYLQGLGAIADEFCFPAFCVESCYYEELFFNFCTEILTFVGVNAFSSKRSRPVFFPSTDPFFFLPHTLSGRA